MSIRTNIMIKYLLVLLLLIGCKPSEKITRKSELRERGGKGPIRALTIDSLLYTFDSFTVSDTTLNGRGKLKRNNSISDFEGSVPFNRIVFIEGINQSVWRTIEVITTTAVIAAGIIPGISEGDQFEIQRTNYGSCPYVYAFDGKSYHLEAEVFGTSISKALEAQTFHVLPSLVLVGDFLSFRIANERPETQFINSVNLFCADLNDAFSAVLDVNNILWPVYHPDPPYNAMDHSKKEILGKIKSVDKRLWDSDLANIAPSSGLRDQLEIEFMVPKYAKAATLIIHAINTNLINAVYKRMGALLGDATLEFYNALEKDSSLQANISDWIHECGLKVEVLEGANWKEIGVILPEANVVPFVRGLRIDGLNESTDRIQLRLSSLTGVWRLDAVQVDFTPVQPLQLHPLELIKAQASNGIEAKKDLELSDDRYTTLLPLEYLNLSYGARSTITLNHPIYVVAARGYMYEWFTTTEEGDNLSLSTGQSATERIDAIKLLIRNKEIFLPPIYALWKDIRDRDN